MLASTRLSPPRRGWIPALWSAVLILGSPSSTLASKIEFRWPLPARATVSMSVLRDSVPMTMRWDMRVHATPHPDELRVRSDNGELLQLGDVGEAPPVSSGFASGMEALLAKSPPITISRAGEYLRFSGMDEMKEGFLDLMRSASREAAIPDSLWKRVEAVLRSPEMTAQIESAASESWNLWVGNWLDLELEPGEELTGEVPLTLGDVTVPVKLTFRHLGASSLDPEIVWLELETVYEGEAATRAMERYFRSMVREVGGDAIPSEPVFQSIRRVDRATVALEARTARPSYAGSSQEIEAVGRDGSRTTRPTRTEYFFEWSPPLGRAKRRDPMPDSTVAWFRAGRLEEAHALLRRAAAEGSRNPDVHACLGDVLRRTGRPGDAVLAGRRALSLDPRHAYAHEVLASAFNPMYGSWRKASADSAWAHLLEGVACDSTDGNLWIAVYLEALRRGRSDLASRSLRSLMASKFFTPAVLAYARWMLEGLPERTLLLTNGDLDTYPAWCLQEVEGLRPDVVVANMSLLNEPWYARHIRDRHSVPLPVADAALDSIHSNWTGQATTPSSHLLSGWAAMHASRSLPNPPFISVTVTSGYLDPMVQERMSLVGASWRVCADSCLADVDTSAVRRSLEKVRPEEFLGAAASPRDRSPVRARGRGVLGNIVQCRLKVAEAFLAAGDRARAGREIQKARDLAKRADLEGVMAVPLQEAQTSFDRAPR